MPTTVCPKCKDKVFVDATNELGNVISCEECETDLELVGLDPIELDVYEKPDLENYGDGFNIHDDEL